MDDKWIPKNKRQYETTKEQAQNFWAAYRSANAQDYMEMGIHPKIAEIMVSNCKAMAERLDEQCKRYEQIRDAGLTVSMGFLRCEQGQLKQATLRHRGKELMRSPWFEAEDEAVQCVYELFLGRKQNDTRA